VNMIVKNEYLALEVSVDLTVESAKIVSIKKNETNDMLAIDQYGADSTFFTSGKTVTVITNNGDEVDVRGTYTLPQDFYTNASKYFGKILPITVTFSYNGGKDTILTETLTENVYVLDRKIQYLSDSKYRSFVIDPFVTDDIDGMPTHIGISMFKDEKGTAIDEDGAISSVYTSVNEFSAVVDWSAVLTLIKNQESNYVFAAPTTYTYYDALGRKIEVKQSVIVPIMVLNRTIIDTDFDPETETDIYEYVYTDRSRTTTITDTYRSTDDESGDYLQIVFSKNEGSYPTQLIYSNQFAYRGRDGLPKNITFTFSGGDEKDYKLSYVGLPSFEELNAATTTRRDIKIIAWSGTPDDEEHGSFKVATIDVELVIRPSAVSIYNTDIAYNGMSVGNYVHEFNPYDEESNSVFALDAEGNYKFFAPQTTYYVGGEFIKLSKWNDNGARPDNEYYRNPSWTQLRTIYQALGTYEVDNVNGEYGYDAETDRYYILRYDEKVGKYFIATGAADEINSGYEDVEIEVEEYYEGDRYRLVPNTFELNAKARTYSTWTEDPLNPEKEQYVFVYVTKQLLDVEWNLDDISYTYKGGISYAKATIASPSDENKCETTISVPVRFVNERATSYDFNGLATSTDLQELYRVADADHDNDYFYIDPFSALNGDFFARVNGTVPTSERYAEQEDGTYALDPNGLYKKTVDEETGEDKYVKLTYAEIGDYKYFPNMINIYIAGSDAPVTVPVEWDFSGVNVSYAGGTFTANAYINNDGRYDFAGNKVDAQRIRVTVEVENRTAVKEVSDLSSIKGYITNGEAINPYNYTEPVMPPTLSVKLASGDEYPFYVSGNDNYKLTWSFSTFRPNYKGDLTYVTAILVGPDGSAQKLKIPFKVYKMEASQIKAYDTSTKTVNTSLLNSAVSDGVVTNNFVINPYEADRINLPVAYSVDFKQYAPQIDDETNEFVGHSSTYSTVTEIFSYAIVTEPTTLTFNVASSGITTNAVRSASDYDSATIQLSNQERLTIGYTVASTASITSTPTLTASATTLTTKTTVGTYNNVPVVWFGWANVYSSNKTDAVVVARYRVVLAGADGAASIAPPSIAGRKIVYELYAAVGAVVNKNGKVMAMVDGTAATDSAGYEIPAGQNYSTMRSVTVYGK